MKTIPNSLEDNICISSALKSIHDIILQIQNELELINNIIETHSQNIFIILENMIIIFN